MAFLTPVGQQRTSTQPRQCICFILRVFLDHCCWRNGNKCLTSQLDLTCFPQLCKGARIRLASDQAKPGFNQRVSLVIIMLRMLRFLCSCCSTSRGSIAVPAAASANAAATSASSSWYYVGYCSCAGAAMDFATAKILGGIVMILS